MNKRSTSIVTRTGSLTTPYASRGNRAIRSTDYPGSTHKSLVSNNLYSPLTDPHLKGFFQQKLMSGLSQSERRPSSRYGTPTRTRTLSAPHQRTDQSPSSYKVTVRTGQSGTSSKIFITLAGSKGKVLRKRLTKGGQRDFTFKANTVETFRLRGGHLGQLKYIIVENEGLKVTDGWFCESVSVSNQHGDKWTCPCNQWFSLHQSDCQLTRKCKARPYTSKAAPPTTYPLEVHTGDVRGAGTAANVFVTLNGSKCSSGKTHLPGQFERGSVVRGSMEASDLGRMKSLTVEHDNTGFGSDWFLDYISLAHNDTKLFFHCAQWLSRTEGDGLIQRTLHVTSDPPQPYVGKTYIVTTQTGKLRGSGTDANVYVCLYGAKGNSGKRRLDNDPANFTRGRLDTFSVTCCDLGTLSKVKVRHDNTGLHPGWLLESVSVSCEGVEVCFPCGQWLEMCDGCGGDIELELETSERTKPNTEQEAHPYAVTVVTGSRPGSGTNANVYIVLHGCHGDSRRLWLSNGGRSFQCGCEDVFSVVCPCDLGSLEMVSIGHDNSGVGPGWFCKQVTVRCESTQSVSVFPCERWLCMDSGDGRIQRELHPLVNEPNERRGTWTVHVWTSDIRGAGTDANVTLQVHGSHGDSSVIPLGDGVANFEQGERDVFCDVPVCDSVGEVESVTLTHDGSRPFPDWHLDKISLVHSGIKYTCSCDRWLIANKDGTGAKVTLKAVKEHVNLDNDVAMPTKGDTTPTYLSDDFESSNEDLSKTHDVEMSSYQEFDSSITNQYVKQLRYEQLSSVESSNVRSAEGTPSHTVVDFDTIPYTVHVMAGAPPACDPAPFLIITLVGPTHSSRPIKLERLGTSQIVPGRPETYSIESENVGHISSIKVTLDGPSNCPPWLIEEIDIHSPTLGHTHHFMWGRGMIPDKEVEIKETSTNTNSTLAVSPLPQDTQGLIGYEVKVYTSDKKHAGTKNNLHLILTGQHGSSKLFTIKNRSMFQRGHIDTFQIATPTIGTLVSIKVAHSPKEGRDSEGGSSEWYLFQIVLSNLSDGTSHTFLCRRWLPESKDTNNYITLHREQK